jgi:hypothetical protein
MRHRLFLATALRCAVLGATGLVQVILMLMKQLTDNPEPESRERGQRLLNMCEIFEPLRASQPHYVVLRFCRIDEFQCELVGAGAWSGLSHHRKSSMCWRSSSGKSCRWFCRRCCA